MWNEFGQQWKRGWVGRHHLSQLKKMLRNHFYFLTKTASVNFSDDLGDIDVISNAG